MTDRSRFIEEEIFREGAGTFAVLDGASVPALLERLEAWQPEYVCLYLGDLKPDLAEAAPYLVALAPGSEFSDWVLAGWGNHWGIFAIAEADLRTLRQHFRRLLTVHDETGKPLLFRYYDPRVLRAYLPTCNAAELAEIFGPVAAYAVEGDGPDTALWFELRGGALARNEKQIPHE